MNRIQYTIAFGLAVTLCLPTLGQDQGGGGADPGNGGGQPGNGNGQPANGQNINLVPGFGGEGGGGNQVDPIARALMIREGYKNHFNVDQPFASSARSHIDAEFYQKYAIAAFDLFNTYRKRVVNEQAYIVKTFKDADRANRREQDQLTKEQSLAARRNAFSRIVEAMNALPTPKNVVATGRPLNAYLDRVNQAGSFGGLLTAGTSEAFKLHKPEAIRISSGVGERAARLPIVGKNVPIHPPAFLSLDAKLKAKLDRYDATRKDVWAAPIKADAVATAQDVLTDLDSEVTRRFKGMKVFAFHDEDYQDSLAWKKFFGDERRLLAWAAVNPNHAAFEGKTVVDLLMYLRSNGYTFAAADPGDEDAYAALHQQLRDLCVKASGEPESVMGERLKDFIEQTDRLRERLPPAAATTVGPPAQGGGN